MQSGKSILGSLRGEFHHFRTHFKYPERVNWFPGHMAKAMRQLKTHFIPNTHLIMEIRDARLPLSSEHPDIAEIAGAKPRLVVLNKADLLSNTERERLEAWSRRQVAIERRTYERQSVFYLMGTAEMHSKVFSKQIGDSIVSICKQCDIVGSTSVVHTAKCGDDATALLGRAQRRKRQRSNWNNEEWLDTRRRDARLKEDSRRAQLNSLLSGHCDINDANEVIDTFDDDLRPTVILEDDGKNGTNFDDCGKNGRKKRGVKSESIIDTSAEILAVDSKDLSRSVMVAVMGYPNVGKSTAINALRALYHKKDSAVIGKLPGVTRHISYFKLLSSAKLKANVYLLDTPGIFVPNVRLNADDCDGMEEMRSAMLIALCGSIADKPLGSVFLADFALFSLNQRRQFQYVRFCGKLEKPSDRIEEVLQRLAEKNGFHRMSHDKNFGQMRNVDEVRAAEDFLRMFRQGLFGKLVLDDLRTKH